MVEEPMSSRLVLNIFSTMHIGLDKENDAGMLLEDHVFLYSKPATMHRDAARAL